MSVILLYLEKEKNIYGQGRNYILSKVFLSALPSTAGMLETWTQKLAIETQCRIKSRHFQIMFNPVGRN